jgi:CheY-like chemotaxis protein
MADRRSSRPILVVDDETDIREALRDALEFSGHPVVLAANGSEALATLPAIGCPCIVLLDLMMPVMDGQEFLERFRILPAYSSVPVYLCTAGGRSKLPGTQGLLRKPFELDELEALVQKHCV